LSELGFPAAAAFVGRAAELDGLQASLSEAAAGETRVHLVGGEPGIGKTRILVELARRAQGVTVLWSRCHDGGGAPAFWPWTQVLEGYMRNHGAAALGALADSGAQNLAQLVGGGGGRALEGPEAQDPEQARFALFVAVSRFLARAGAAQPLLVLLDDIHWADEPSLLLLEFVTRELRDEPVCIVASYRDSDLESGGPLARTVPRLVGEPHVRSVLLHGMDSDEVGRCLALALGRAPAARLVEAVARRTEGNPFFVSQIGRQAARHHDADLESWFGEVPATVRGMIESRLGRLSPAAREVVSVAAVLGRTVGLPALSATCELPGPAVLDGINEAARLGIVNRLARHPRAYMFIHTLVRETVAAALPAAVAARLHRRAVIALSPAVEQGRMSAAEVAEHAWEAARSGEVEDLVAAVDWAVRAAELATGQLAFEAAAQHYERAIDAAARLREDPGRSVELQLLLGEAQSRSGDMAAGQATLLRAADAARQAERGDLLARAALTYRIGGLAGFQFDDPDPRLRGLLEDALVSVPADDSAVRARLLARLAMELHFTDEDERRERLSDDAVAMARRLGEARLLAETLGARHIAHWRPENVVDQLAVATEVCRIAREIGDRELELQGEYWRLCDLLELGDAVAVDESLEAVARLAGELDQPLYTWWVVSRRAMRLLLAGEFAEAKECMDEQLAQGIRLKRSNAVQQYGGQLLLLKLEQGTAHEMVDAVEALVRDFPRDPTWRIVHAWLLGHIGRRERARAELAELAAAGFPLGHGFTRMICMALLCEVVADVEAVQWAGEVHAALAPFADRAATAGTATICYGPAALPLARVSTLLGELDRAEQEFEAALRVSEALRSRPCTARTQAAYAEMLEKRGRVGDAEAAVDRAGAAREAAAALGMPVLARRAEALVERVRPQLGPASVGRRAPGPVTGWGALTQREREVVRLALEGLPAKAIGERLFIGRRTVETHLANAYGKLGVSSRVELVKAGTVAP
jgi:DNA-binding CsgD family transcriptional regulator